MSFKLDKADNARRDRLVEELREGAGKIEDAMREYNEAVAALRAPVEELVAAYNETLEEAKGFAEDIGNTADATFDERSEKWREGEKGEAAGVFRDAWMEIDLEPYEVDFPAEMEVEAPSHADDLEGLPAEAEEVS